MIGWKWRRHQRICRAKLTADLSKSNQMTNARRQNKVCIFWYAPARRNEWTRGWSRRCLKSASFIKITHHVPTLTRLLINIDHIATLRNARQEAFPDPVHGAAICEAAGADGIVFHLREDRRHINDRDVRLLKETVKGKLGFELSTAPDIVDLCCEIVPEMATLVPERREEVTTEGGLDVRSSTARVREISSRLRSAGIEEVSLFIEPDTDQVEASIEAGANCVELHTGNYANATTHDERMAILERLATAAERARELGLRVHAGHGLNYRNYPAFGKYVPHVEEVSIGFAIIAQAVLVGLDRAVQDMATLVRHGSAR